MRRIEFGETVMVKLPWSEVCMHMRVQDQIRPVFVNDHCARIMRPDGTPFAPGITYGEAGLYRDAQGLYTDDLVLGECAWFAMCTNEATHTQSHPILGEVPICERCQRSYDNDGTK